MNLFPLQVWHYRHRQSQDFVQGKFLQGEIYSIMRFLSVHGKKHMVVTYILMHWQLMKFLCIHVSNSPCQHTLIYQGDTQCKDTNIRHVSLWREIFWIIIVWLSHNFCSNLFGITCWTTTKRTRHWWKVSLNSTLLLLLLIRESVVRYAGTKQEFEFFGVVCFAGPLNNLKESMIQFSKPRKLVNRTNPVWQLLHLPSIEPFFIERNLFWKYLIVGTLHLCLSMQFNLT